MSSKARRTLVGVAAAIMIAAPAAPARPIDDPAQTPGSAHVPPPPSSIAQSVGVEYGELRSPDARGAAAGRGTVNARDVMSPQVFTDQQHAIVERFTRSPSHQEALREAMLVKLPQPAPGRSEGGIDWGDAGMGAAGMLALTLLAIGGTVAVSNRRHTLSGTQAATTR
jgi:hypothetical protein